MAGLFGTTLHLNRGNYSASIATVELSFRRTLEQEARALRSRMAEQEAQAFALRGTERELEQDLFFITAERVIPACVAYLFEPIPEQDARNAFTRGIELLPDDAALPFFWKAAQGTTANADDAYRKISALFNILEIKPNLQATCGILYLLSEGNALSDASRTRFFRTLLEGLVPDLPSIEPRFSALVRSAKEIDAELTRRKGAYRDTFHGRMLSVRKDGLAALYVFDFIATEPVVLTPKPPKGSCVEVVKGIYAVIPAQVMVQAKAEIRRQYYTGNTILALLLILGVALAVGMLFAIRRQRQLEAARIAFVATVSHELRTPLSLIRLHAETLRHGRIPPERVAEYHQTILNETERLTGIVNNVLDFSRMERGKMQIHLGPTNLSETTGRIVESFRYRLEKEGFELEQAIDADVIAKADALAYSQILFNLLDNAIKYSDSEKSIRIELESSKGWSTLRVSDHGIGIPDSLKKKVFNDFVRSGDRKVTAQRGSGIGLGVARRLVEKMNGTIEVEDHPPKGSVFIVKLESNNEATGG